MSIELEITWMKCRVLLGLSAFFLPTIVGALGLGKLELNSALHEPFNARIELLSASVEELNSLDVSLADNEAFERAGIPRKYILTRLRFSVRETEVGPDYIELRSTEAIREPFLNFLLEINWSKGKLYKEYTALLDPPKNVIPPPVKKRPAPALIEGDERGIIRRPADSQPATERAISYLGGDYGPIVTGDTLWSIAKATRPDRTVSIQQMMLAIVRLNPGAFIENNINGLRRGEVLNMPDFSEITAVGKSAAFASAHEQNVLWDEYKGHVASRVAEQPVTAVAPAPIAPVAPESVLPSETPARDGLESPPDEVTEPAAPAEPAVTPPAPVEPVDEAELRLISESDKDAVGQEAEESPGREARALGNELALKSEAIEALSMENAELQDQLIESEIIINDLQRLIALKGDELALIQEQIRAATEPAQELPPTTGEVGETPGEAVVEDVTGEAVADIEEDVPEAEGVEVTEVPEQETSIAEGAFISLAELVDKAKALIGQAQAYWPVIATVLGGVLLLGGAGVAVSRWRQRKASEVVVLPPTTSELSQAGEVSEVSDDLDDLSESETELPRDMESTQTGGDLDVFDVGDETEFPEVQDAGKAKTAAAGDEDAMEDVNILLAYEQFDEAADFIKKALQKDPDNLDYHGKLLEVYYSEGNKHAYEESARAIHDRTDGQGEHWDAAVAMWNELSPNRELFAAPTDDEDEASPVSGDTGVLNIAGEGGTDAEMDFDIGGEKDEVDLDITPSDSGRSLDFSLDEEEAGAAPSLDEEKAAPSLEDSSESLNFTMDEEDMLDLTSLSKSDVKISDMEPTVHRESVEPAGDLDASLTDDLSESVVAATSDGVDEVDVDPSERITEKISDADDGGLDFAVDDESVEGVDLAVEESAEELGDADDGGLGFAVDDESVEGVDSAVEESTVEISDADDGGLDFAADDESVSEGVDSAVEEGAVELGDADDGGLDFAADDESVSEDAESPALSIDDTIIDTQALEPLSMGAVADANSETPTEDSIATRVDNLLDDTSMKNFDSNEDLLDITTINDGSKRNLEDAVEDLDEALDDFDAESDLVSGLESLDDEASQELDTTPPVAAESPLEGGEETVELEEDVSRQVDEQVQNNYDQTFVIPKSPSLKEQSADEEMASQLDLAKAYIELGEHESAKMILDDILEHGDENYRRQAEELSKQLS